MDIFDCEEIRAECRGGVTEFRKRSGRPGALKVTELRPEGSQSVVSLTRNRELRTSMHPAEPWPAGAAARLANVLNRGVGRSHQTANHRNPRQPSQHPQAERCPPFAVVPRFSTSPCAHFLGPPKQDPHRDRMQPSHTLTPACDGKFGNPLFRCFRCGLSPCVSAGKPCATL